MTVFYVFLTVILTLLAIAVGMYVFIPWLMERDCEFELRNEDLDNDLIGKQDEGPVTIDGVYEDTH